MTRSTTSESTNRSVELAVSYHQSGRYTLTEKTGTAIAKDGKGRLFGNQNAATFYRAVGQRIADLVAEGAVVTYEDTTLDSA